MKVFVTKRVLSSGIKEVDCEILVDGYLKGYASPVDKNCYEFYKPNSEYFFDLDSAKKNANERRDKKIAQLKKQLKQLEAKTF